MARGLRCTRPAQPWHSVLVLLWTGGEGFVSMALPASRLP